MPADYGAKIIEFQKFVTSWRRKFNFKINQIVNVDEVPLTFDVPSNRTVDSKGIISVVIKTTDHEINSLHCSFSLLCEWKDTRLC